MTNLDRFRAMTDAEIAEFLMGVNDCAVQIPFCKNSPECYENDFANVTAEKCMACMVDWLNSPMEGKRK